MELSLALTASLDLAGVEKMLRTLRSVPGVCTVEAYAGSSRVHVQYDDDLTSAQEISMAVTHAGFPLQKLAGGGSVSRWWHGNPT